MRRLFFMIAAVFMAAGALSASAAPEPPTAPASPPQVSAGAPSPATGKEAKVPLPKPRPAALAGKKTPGSSAAASDEEALQAPDTDETLALPPYPAGGRVSMGKAQTYTISEEDTLLDVARHFRLGFVEVRAANPKTDPWSPTPGEEVVIPSFRLLPRAPQKGIVVNLAQMRMYYFVEGRKEPLTFPIGVGREGLQTPTGETTIIRKAAGPVWFPTERMREEKPWLPAAVPAGPSNPLGTHALYLGWPTFLIHGSNKPWAIGRRVSSGCMRMYPEDIRDLFGKVEVGTKVTVVDQPILVGWVGDDLYLEANPSKNQANDIEIDGEHEIKEMTEALKKVILDAAGVSADKIDWKTAKQALDERRGIPVVIAGPKTTPVAEPAKRARTARDPQYN